MAGTGVPRACHHGGAAIREAGEPTRCGARVGGGAPTATSMQQLRPGALDAFLATESCQQELSSAQVKSLRNMLRDRMLDDVDDLLSAEALEKVARTARNRRSHGHEASALNRLRQICGLQRISRRKCGGRLSPVFWPQERGPVR
jgi:hypothetical protein